MEPCLGQTEAYQSVLWHRVTPCLESMLKNITVNVKVSIVLLGRGFVVYISKSVGNHKKNLYFCLIHPRVFQLK